MERLTIDELIAQERKTAEHNHNMYEYECSFYGKDVVDSGEKLDCVKEYEYHSQIVELLEELKKRRSEDYGYMADIHQNIGYNKAIDDFVKEVKNLIVDLSVIRFKDIDEIAEQLKTGDKNG